ncbi:T9SS type A sorting domain-containing protein [Arcicella lustrica]|uniref:T9SS type A sorting domain-containing protein n=1 Tax=Arcicella lustrica TaxID=2984196 RepID=A0ABU5SQ16_9BACT|nr:T9SS type A sorting domain-containing protein [Arcicella sp. DC25W]MEA5429353.1 T9SS type A sorting domain-containing protein [Arcicella sp. DC25W]
MEKRLLFILIYLAPLLGFSQSIERIKIASITPSENTGQDYSPWLNDDLNDQVQSAWTGNFKWVDVTLSLERSCKVSKISLYDAQGTFENTPVSIYATDGTNKVLLGLFKGLTYNSFVDIILDTPVDAKAIIIHKYANDIPQKVQIYGIPTSAIIVPTQPVVTPAPVVVVAPTVAAERIKITAVKPSEETGQDFTPWLNDDLNNYVENAWGSSNNRWVDVKLTLEKRSKITKLSLYDTEGSFTEHPVSLYALDGTNKTLLGTFEGLTYKTFVDIVVASPFDADAIIVRKYGNDIPQKVYVYGLAATTPAVSTQEEPVVTPEPNPVVVTPTPAPTPTEPTAIPERIKIIAVKPSENTGQDFTPWLNDDLNNYVESAWGSNNNKWVDVKLTLEKRSKITKLSLYDTEGTFTEHPVSLYALDGANKIFLGLFEGLTYKTFVDIVVASPFDADAIIVRKYGNDIPQKVYVYGLAATTPAVSVPEEPVVTPEPDPVVVTPTPTPSPVVKGTKITIDPKRWYELNTIGRGLKELVDGDITTTVQQSWIKVMTNYDAYYPLLDDEEITLESIRFYDGQGIFVNDPMTLSIITDKWERIPVAKFTGEAYQEWVGPDPANPNSFVLATPPTGKIRYLVINTHGQYPNEMELYGTHKQSTKPVTVAHNTVKMRDGFGANGFEWDFYNPFDADEIDETKFNAVKSFTGFRHYIDWDKLEAREGSYTFNPTFNGGWDYDKVYDRCKKQGIEVLACIQTAPDWLVNTYPEEQRDRNVTPVKFGKSVTDPASYIQQARVAFQFAARYGNNTNVDRSLLSVYDKPRWTFDRVNTVKVGLGVVKYMECGNERDKWWKGRSAYQTAREHAANLSAFYDGHKNTMGPGVGVKNADPTMNVVMAGLASASTDYVRGMIDWCKEFRGYKADGKVDLCWDVINYHLYSDDANSSQSGTSSRGAAPEVSSAGQTAKDFVQMAHDYAYDMPVWISELGYDINQGSALKAIPIGNKSEYVTQADWTLRSSLLYNRLGVAKTFFYEIYDDNFANPLHFSSSGLINQDKTRRPAADYLYQTNKLMGEYVYKETISQDPMVDRYELNGKSAYVLFIPDEKGRTGSYTLNLGNVSKGNLYAPKVGADSMSVSALTGSSGKFTLNVTETPIFFIPTATETATVKTGSVTSTKEMFSLASTEKLSNEMPALTSLNTYPNPTTDYVLLTLENESTENLEVKVSDLTLGRVMIQDVYEKTGVKFSQKISLSDLPVGSYAIEVVQGKDQMVKKIIKTN